MGRREERGDWSISTPSYLCGNAMITTHGDNKKGGDIIKNGLISTMSSLLPLTDRFRASLKHKNVGQFFFFIKTELTEISYKIK